MNNLSYVDLAYELGRIYENKNNVKLSSVDNDIDFYCFHNTEFSVIYAFVNDKKNTLFINKKTDISEVVSFCETLYMMVDRENVSFCFTDMEELTVDRVEGIYYHILASHNRMIVLDENFFKNVPKDGDILNAKLEILVKETKQRKEMINNKFQNLLKK